MEHVILMGASGHAKVVIDILHEMSCREGIEYNIELLDDDASLQGTKIMGHKVVGKISDCVNYPKSRFLISIGNNKIRETLAKRYQLDYMTATEIPIKTILDVKSAMEDIDDLSQDFSFCKPYQSPEHTKHLIQEFLDSTQLSVIQNA